MTPTPFQSSTIVVRKVAPRHNGHHGGTWKIAYADFMTSMLALFVVLWVLAQSQKTRQAIAEYFKDPQASKEEIARRLDALNAKAGHPTGHPSAVPSPVPSTGKDPALAKLRERLVKALQQARAARGRRPDVALEWTADGLRISLLDRKGVSFFAVGSAVPKPYTRRMLTLVGRDLAHMPNEVVIEGHTDRRAYQNDGYGNWELSSDRANAARRLLVGGGMDPRRIAQVAGYADTRLLHPNAPLDPQNRRVTILVRAHPLRVVNVQTSKDGSLSVPAAPPGSGGGAKTP